MSHRYMYRCNWRVIADREVLVLFLVQTRELRPDEDRPDRATSAAHWSLGLYLVALRWYVFTRETTFIVAL